MKVDRLSHRFVEFIPADLEEGVLYVSLEYSVAQHKCCCGCGLRVVTPLSPTDWVLTYDGEAVSLDPSIGNWSFPCQSHYWIERGHVRPSRKMSRTEIDAVRRNDRLAKARRYTGPLRAGHAEPTERRAGFLHRAWQRVMRRMRGD